MIIPKKIYLQIVDDEGNELDPMKDEVTWCWDKINDNDVEYEIVPTPLALDEVTAERVASLPCPQCGKLVEVVLRASLRQYNIRSEQPQNVNSDACPHGGLHEFIFLQDNRSIKQCKKCGALSFLNK